MLSWATVIVCCNVYSLRNIAFRRVRACRCYVYVRVCTRGSSRLCLSSFASSCQTCDQCRDFKKLWCRRCAPHLRWKPRWARRTAEPELNRSDVRRGIFERRILATSLPSTVIVSPRRGNMCQSDKINPVVGSLFRCVVWTVVRNHFQVGWCDVWQERCFSQFPFSL